MKNRMTFVGILTVSLVMLVAVAPASANTGRSVTGSYQWVFPEDGFHAWGNVNVHETGNGNEATGWASLREIKESEEGTVYWRAHAICVDFFEYEGKPAAAVVLQADIVKGTWWAGKVGQYWTAFFVDGGTPGSEGDLIGAVWDPGRVPSDEPPGCGFEEDASWYGPSGAGNLTVHGYP